MDLVERAATHVREGKDISALCVVLSLPPSSSAVIQGGGGRTFGVLGWVLEPINEKAGEALGARRRDRLGRLGASGRLTRPERRRRPACRMSEAFHPSRLCRPASRGGNPEAQG